MLENMQVSRRQGEKSKTLSAPFIENRTYNNGDIATDPLLASKNFLNALEKIPGLIDKEQKNSVEMEKDLPILRKVVNSTWRKEDDLQKLKSDLAALERQIQLTLSPVEQNDSVGELSSEEVTQKRDAPMIVPVAHCNEAMTSLQAPEKKLAQPPPSISVKPFTKRM